MDYRVLFLANPVKLSVKNEQLMIDNGEITRVPYFSWYGIIAERDFSDMLVL